MQELSLISQISLYILLGIMGIICLVWTIVHFKIIYSF